MEDFHRMLLMDRYGPTGCTVLDIVVSRVYKNGYYLETPLEYLATMEKECSYRQYVRSDEAVCLKKIAHRTLRFRNAAVGYNDKMIK